MKNSLVRKAVVYGGMFDPPHRGHFALIKAALREADPDVFYIVPGAGSPFKAPPSASFRDRAAMLKDGLRAEGMGGDARIVVDPYEAERGRVTYTWRTAAFFRRKHPRAEIYFLMGSDCLSTFRRWKNYRRITGSARLLVGVRSGFPVRGAQGLSYERLRGRFPAAASTALKAGLFAGAGRPGLLRSTAAYIGSKGLYMHGLRRVLARSLPPDRFRHSLGTARLALELAQKHGADLRKTALAALLHDAARGLPPREMAARAAACRPRMPELKEAARNSPVTLHPYAGAAVAACKFGVTERDVLKAVRCHALGCAAPSLLDKIIFVSDLAETGRGFPEARGIRELAFRDLDAAYAAAQYFKLAHVLKAGRWIHPESVRAWNGLLERNN